MAKNDGIFIDMEAKNLTKRINALIDIDMKPLHEDLGEEIIQIIQGRFDSSTDVRGKKFKPIAPYMYRLGNQKLKRTAGSPPLKAGLGAPPLRNSFEFEATEDEVFVGTPVNHAKYHSSFPNNNGKARKQLAEREFMGIETNEDLDRLLGIVDDYLDRVGG